jgi:hypothetical protein
VIGYALLGIGLAVLFSRLSAAVEVAKSAVIQIVWGCTDRQVVTKLAMLFAVMRLQAD